MVRKRSARPWRYCHITKVPNPFNEARGTKIRKFGKRSGARGGVFLAKPMVKIDAEQRCGSVSLPSLHFYHPRPPKPLQRAAREKNMPIASTRAVGFLLGFLPRNVADWSRSTTVGIASSRRGQKKLQMTRNTSQETKHSRLARLAARKTERRPSA